MIDGDHLCGYRARRRRSPAVEGYPRELAAVVIQKTWGEADAFPSGDIDAGRVVIRTVEILGFARSDQAVLHSTKRRGRPVTYDIYSFEDS